MDVLQSSMSQERKQMIRLTWKRFSGALRMLAQSEEGSRALVFAGTLLAMMVGMNGLNVLNSYVGRDFMSAIENRNVGEFRAQALLYAMVFVASTVVAALFRFTEERLGILWRRQLTWRLTETYMSERAYHRLDSATGVANPDQRITEDVKAFTTTTLSFMLLIINGTLPFRTLPWAPAGLVDEVMASVLQPTVDVMRERGTPFSGLLYAGLALTSRGVRVIEFNARFGDPETQVVLALLESPITDLLLGSACGTLHEIDAPRWGGAAAVTVVVAAAGYPASPRTGDPITGISDADAMDGVSILHAGTRLSDSGEILSNGGRVLSVTATGDSLSEARVRAYAALDCISLAGSHARRDIAAAAAGEI